MRIIAFGCSMTFGQSLPDCVQGKKSDLPSQYAWPSVLGRLARRPVINLAVPGASNLEILHTIKKFINTIGANDIVCVMWSYIERSCVIKNDSVLQIGPWIDKPYSREYYRLLHDASHDRFMYQLYVQHADYVLRSQTDNILFTEVSDSGAFPLQLECIPVNYGNISVAEDQPPNDLGVDGMHPGIIQHERLAKQILPYVRPFL